MSVSTSSGTTSIILMIGDSVLIGQALEAGRVDAAVLDGGLARRLISKGFSVIVDLTPANIPMVNQAIVVAPGLCAKAPGARRTDSHGVGG